MSRDNFYIDHVKPFAITLKRYGAKRIGRVVQWSFRSWKHLAVALLIVIVVVVGAQQLIKGGQRSDDAAPQQHAPQETDEDAGLNFREVPADPISEGAATGPDADESAAPDMGGNDQAATPAAGATPSYGVQKVAEPSQPSPDRSDADETAEALAAAYLSRGGGDQWQDWTAELTNEDLADYLADAKTPIDDRGASEVEKVTISKKPFAGAPKDTPVRWSRNVAATVKTETGGTLLVNFETTMMLNADSQWEATDFAQTTWKAVG